MKSYDWVTYPETEDWASSTTLRRPTPSCVVMIGMASRTPRISRGARISTRGEISDWTACESENECMRLSVTRITLLALHCLATCHWPSSEPKSHSDSLPCNGTQVILGIPQEKLPASCASRRTSDLSIVFCEAVFRPLRWPEGMRSGDLMPSDSSVM